jgi:hypothetical protein
MHNYSAVYILFRLLNFAVFIAVVAYVYRRYVRPAMLAQEADQVAQLSLLQEKVTQADTLIAQQQQLQRQAMEEGRCLIVSVENWIAYKKNKMHEHDQCMVERVQLIRERNSRMAQGYAEAQIKQQLKPLVIANAAHCIHEKLQDKDVQAAYLNRSLHALKGHDK